MVEHRRLIKLTAALVRTWKRNHWALFIHMLNEIKVLELLHVFFDTLLVVGALKIKVLHHVCNDSVDRLKTFRTSAAWARPLLIIYT